MQELVQFCVDNWQWLLTAILSIFVLFIQIFKKRPIADYLSKSALATCSNWLAFFMNIAEHKYPGDGVSKKQYVINECIKMTKKSIKLDEATEDKLRDSFGILIEQFLSTPKKKG